MSTRLQVVMSEDELDEIRAAAERRGMNMSTWVRQVLREERDRERTGRGATGARVGALRETPAPYGAGSSATGPHTPPPTPLERVRVEMALKEDLLDAVQLRYRLPNRRAAVEFALRRAAVLPMSRDEALGMEGAGWEGDLDDLRSGDPGAPW